MELVLALLFALLGVGSWAWSPDKPRELLEARYAAAPSSFAAIAGVRLHIRDTGPLEAPAVIMLHGFAASLHTWDGWAAGLEADHRVIRLDLPGFGLTGADPTGTYTDARSQEVLLALMDRFQLRQAALVGHSMGGRLAWSFAARHPDRVSRLVLVAPAGFAGPGAEYGRRPEVPAMARVMEFVLPLPLLRANLAPAYGERGRLDEAVVHRYRDLLLAPGVRGAILARMEQSTPEDPLPALRGLTMPVLLLWGERDRMIPPGHAQDYLAAVPQARLVLLPGLGHVPQEEAPEAALPALRAFLAP